jgi:hypothetical protein
MIRAFLVAGLAVWAGAFALAQQPRPASAPARPPIINEASENGFETVVKPFLKQTCVECHGNETHKRELNFEKFTSASSLIEHRER